MHFAGSFALWLLMMREASRGTGAPPTAWAPEDLDVFVQTEQARAAVEAVVAAQLSVTRWLRVAPAAQGQRAPRSATAGC